MASEIERERETLLEQIDNQGRVLERRAPADAIKLNAALRKVVEWLVVMSQTGNPRGPKGK